MTPCLLNLCSSLEMTQAVVYWQTLCMLAISSVVEVPGFATDSIGLAENPTMAISKTTGGAASPSVPAPTLPTYAPSLDSLLSGISFLASRTAQLEDYLISEIDSIGTPTGTSSRASDSSSSGSSSSSLSTGAKAGIAVGVVGVTLAAAIGIWLFCRRRRRTKAVASTPYICRDEGFSEKMPATTTQQVESTKYPGHSTQRKPVEHSHMYPEMDGRTAVDPVSTPNGLYGNELEGQNWPAAHETRGELPA